MITQLVTDALTGTMKEINPGDLEQLEASFNAHENYQRETKFDYSFIKDIGSYNLGFATAEVKAGIFMSYLAATKGVLSAGGNVVPTSEGDISFAATAGLDLSFTPQVKVWANAEGSIKVEKFGFSARGTLGIDLDLLDIRMPFYAQFKLDMEHQELMIDEDTIEYSGHRPYLGLNAGLDLEMTILPHSEIYASGSVEVLGIKIIDTGKITLFKDMVPGKESINTNILSIPVEYQKIYLDDLYYYFK